MQPPEALGRYEPAIEAHIEALLAPREGALYAMMKHHLGMGQPSATRGKRLRPTLALLTTEAVGGKWQSAVPGAVALEVLHNFSLIHDDIQDESPTRRGQSTLWWKWGTAQSINAGDGMHALARLALLDLEQTDVSASTILSCGRLLDETCLVLCEGQYLDIEFQTLPEVAIEKYLDMIYRKTAKLFGTSLEIGALLGGADLETAARFRNAGHNLGLAHQIRDDALDLWGSEAFGKVRATDVHNKKKTMPIVFGLAQKISQSNDRLRALYSQPTLSNADILETIELLEELGAREYCEQEAQRHLQAALDELKDIAPPSKALDELRAVARFFVSRDH